MKNRKIMAAVGITAGAFVLAAMFFLRLDGNDTLSVTRSSPTQTAAAENEERQSAGAQTMASNRSADAPDRLNIPRVLDRNMFDVSKQFPDLARRARSGDIQAAKNLYKSLETCVGVPVDAASIDGLLRQTEIANADSLEEAARSRTFIINRSSNCSQLTNAQRASYRDWLSLAAQSGDHEARLDYVRAGLPTAEQQDAVYWDSIAEYRRLAEEYIATEIQRGNSDALLVAGLNYGSGGVYPQDDVKQYAYIYSYLLASGADAPVFSSFLSRLGEGMSSGRLLSAQSSGEEIYRDCCLK